MRRIEGESRRGKEPEWEMRKIEGESRRGKESEWEMRRTKGGGVDGIKNRSEKCERPRVGGRQDKEPEWEMRRTEVGGGGDQRLFEKIKVFFNKPKT